MRRRKAKVIAKTATRPGWLPLSFLVLLAAALLAGCNTTRGFGEDVSAVGQGISETAVETEREIQD